MMHKYKKLEFIKDDSGAVTVDWVVLCAGIVGLVVVISSQMSDKAVGLGNMTTSYMTNKSPE